MSIRKIAAVGLGLLALVSAAIAEGVPPGASTKLMAAQNAMANAARVYAYLDLQRHPGSGASPGRGTSVWGGIQIDVPGRKFTFDGMNFRWRHVNGQTTFHNATLGRSAAAIAVPTADPLISALLNELDTGFAGSAWTRENPPRIAPGLAPEPAHEWWRLDLAATWDNPYRIYFDLTGVAGCEVYEVVVLYADEDRIVQFKNPVAGDGWFDLRVPLCDAVHWNPTFSQSAYGGPVNPFQSTLFPKQALHRDEFRPPGPHPISQR
ncbi:MAG: hypothetical protein ABMB14_08645 [Myxococcota bacterium]